MNNDVESVWKQHSSEKSSDFKTYEVKVFLSIFCSLSKSILKLATGAMSKF